MHKQIALLILYCSVQRARLNSVNLPLSIFPYRFYWIKSIGGGAVSKEKFNFPFGENIICNTKLRRVYSLQQSSRVLILFQLTNKRRPAILLTGQPSDLGDLRDRFDRQTRINY